MANSTSAWGEEEEEGGNTQQANTVRVLKIRSSSEKMDGQPWLFPSTRIQGKC